MLRARTGLPALFLLLCAAPITALDGWTLHYADEFDGGALDTSLWRRYHNSYGDGNNELQCYTPANVSVGGGFLTITAKRDTVSCPNSTVRHFTSGFLGTREKGRYFPRHGRYEIRARVPHGNALWPAFWLRHRDGAAKAEVDVMEYFHAQFPGKSSGTFHYNDRKNVAMGHRFFETPTRSPGFHVWAAEIEPVDGRICLRFFVDGQFVDFNGKPAGQPHCFEDEGPFSAYPGQGLFDMAVNLAVGGDWVGHPDGPLDRLSNGNPAASAGVLPTTFPDAYVVDYVRVYVRPAASRAQGQGVVRRSGLSVRADPLQPGRAWLAAEDPAGWSDPEVFDAEGRPSGTSRRQGSAALWRIEGTRPGIHFYRIHGPDGPRIGNFLLAP